MVLAKKDQQAKIMAIVFWKCPAILLVHFVEDQSMLTPTIRSVFNEFSENFSRKMPGKLHQRILHHDNIAIVTVFIQEAQLSEFW